MRDADWAMSDQEHEWRFPCAAVRNYDGDTVSLDLDLGFDIHFHAEVRLWGVDTPEMRGGTELTKAAARLARDTVRQWVGDAEKLEYLSIQWSGKYGRPIGDLLLDGRSLTERLIAARLGIPYDGGSRDHVLAEHVRNAEWLREQGRL